MPADTPTDAEMIAAVRRLVSQMEGRKLYLEAEHQAASIHIYKNDLDGMRAVLARLEGLAAPGEWLPIETAPRGMALLYFPERDKGGRNHLLSMMRIDYPAIFPHRPATHWMPLPAAPGDAHG